MGPACIIQPVGAAEKVPLSGTLDRSRAIKNSGQVTAAFIVLSFSSVLQASGDVRACEIHRADDFYDFANAPFKTLSNIT